MRQENKIVIFSGYPLHVLEIKIFIKYIQNSVYLLEEDQELSSREDAIKIHALIHNQLAAPIFRNMIQYAWFASNLIADRDYFDNVNNVCFPERPPKKKCDLCNNVHFAKCSWCKDFLCFKCYYIDYHPGKCTQFFINV